MRDCFVTNPRSRYPAVQSPTDMSTAFPRREWSIGWILGREIRR